jgi:hypothetical protein
MDILFLKPIRVSLKSSSRSKIFLAGVRKNEL